MYVGNRAGLNRPSEELSGDTGVHLTTTLTVKDKLLRKKTTTEKDRQFKKIDIHSKEIRSYIINVRSDRMQFLLIQYAIALPLKSILSDFTLRNF